jgi:cholesterol transport system auxiliary component
VDLDELVQLFHTPERSEGLVEVRASLLSQQGAPLARRNFAVTVPAQTADAAGGVGSIAAAVGRIAEQLRNWLNSLDRDAAAGLNIAKDCRGA